MPQICYNLTNIRRDTVSHKSILTNYVSEIDQLLISFDQKNPELSSSQRKERQKYLDIYFLRDKPERPETTTLMWEGF